jgi:hypothetical protein
MTPFLIFMVDAALRGLAVAAAIGAVLLLHAAAQSYRAPAGMDRRLVRRPGVPVVGLVTPSWRWPAAPVPVFSAAVSAPQVTGSLTTAAVEIAPAHSSDARPYRSRRSRQALSDRRLLVHFPGRTRMALWQRLRRRARAVADPAILVRFTNTAAGPGSRHLQR